MELNGLTALKCQVEQRLGVDTRVEHSHWSNELVSTPVSTPTRVQSGALSLAQLLVSTPVSTPTVGPMRVLHSAGTGGTRRGLRLKNRFYISLYSLFEERDFYPPRLSTEHSLSK